jgi:uncharacterized UBP type Zn finger protein
MNTNPEQIHEVKETTSTNMEIDDNTKTDKTDVQTDLKTEVIKENKENSENTELKGEPISKYVKQEAAKQLIDMGFSKNVSEKACFFNNNIIEKAIEWCYEHQDDPDFETEERIVAEKEKP